MKWQKSIIPIIFNIASADLAPMAYLNRQYAGHLGVLWIDTHPDVQRSYAADSLEGLDDEEDRRFFLISFSTIS